MARHKLFGSHIQPDCTCCSHNLTPDSAPTCAVHKTISEQGQCAKFSYDPLLRKPQSLPPLPQFCKEDFKL